jgi:hypothetical protein
MPVPKRPPMRGIVRPVLFALGAAVMIAAAALGRALDATRPAVDDTCACRNGHRSHRSSPRVAP